MDQVNVLGKVLKATRQRHGWTLADVAKRSGISATTLSKVERGRLSLTYEKIIDLARGLGVEVGALFHEAASESEAVRTARRSIMRVGEGTFLETPSLAYTYLNTELLNKQFYPLILEVKARTLAEFGPLTAHEGEQFIYVIEGELEIHTEHYAPARLAAGDSIYFDSSMRHAGISVGEGRCRLLCILSSLGDEREAAIMNESAAPRREPRPGTRPERPVAKRAARRKSAAG